MSDNVNYINSSKRYVIILISLLSLNVYSQNNDSIVELSTDERTIAEQRVIEKINDFLSYLPEIAAKSNKSEEEKKLARKYIDLTLELFIGEGNKYEFQDNAGVWRWHDEVKIQTTSRGRVYPPKAMKRFLNRLMTLPYQKVEFDTCSAIVIKPILYKLPDGRYTANATVMIVARYVQDGRINIVEKSYQNITIYAQPICTTVPREHIWDVKLGDMQIKYEW